MCASSVAIAIGLNGILTMNVQTVVLKLPGTTQSLQLICVANNVRYEFIFTNLGTSHQTFSPVFDILRSYQSTTLYRDMRLRSAIISRGRLNLLPNEELINEVPGVWNLSSDQGNLGTLLTTNVRVVWFADQNDSFNMSLPYLQLHAIDIRNSKYGHALVLTCKERGGGYILGFRLDQERLSGIYKEITSLHAVYTTNPVFGVNYERKKRKEDHQEPEAEIEELDANQLKHINHHFSAYIVHRADPNKEKPIPVYSSEIGFAVEKPRDGLKLKDLFQVVVQ